ncbi:hypothetical protein OUZ56_033564 [Daphnia magna]|uniref:Uncharacterized protein n=1 Tax=Daphnia magna TaxID=35525 RepID=A0ABR0BAU9_9CRUS|nr:hypothetical protein OUZ56_033564 [Daphnia magna]
MPEGSKPIAGTPQIAPPIPPAAPEPEENPEQPTTSSRGLDPTRRNRRPPPLEATRKSTRKRNSSQRPTLNFHWDGKKGHVLTSEQTTGEISLVSLESRFTCALASSPLLKQNTLFKLPLPESKQLTGEDPLPYLSETNQD